MRATIDHLGRIVVPKALRDTLGLTPGTTVDLTRSGSGLALVPVGRTARLRTVGGGLVADSSTAVTDEDVLNLRDASLRG